MAVATATKCYGKCYATTTCYSRQLVRHRRALFGRADLSRQWAIGRAAIRRLSTRSRPRPRASLRSLLLICAFSTACMCRSTQTIGNSASAGALNSHRDSGPASNPIHLKWWRGFLSTTNNALGLLATFTSRMILPCHPHADAGLLDRYVQSSKMVHAALLLLMLKAAKARPRFTISLKRSAQNRQPSTSSPADYPSFPPRADIAAC